MRTFFLLLVLGNVAFFAWSRYVAPPEASADPLPLERQIEPEKLKVIAPSDLPPVTARPAAPAAAAPLALKCLEWGSFTLADAPRAEKALEPLALGARLAQRRTEEAAQARLAALRGLGVRSAQIGARETTVPKVWLQVKGVDGALHARLKDAARSIEGSELRECMP